MENIKASVQGRDIVISTKNAASICRAIKNKTIGQAKALLQDVTKKKKAIAMKGELPHRKGMERGRYPLKACVAFLKLLKSLEANASQKGLETEKLLLHAQVNRAGKVMRSGRRMRRAKRTHVIIFAEKQKDEEKQAKKQEKEKK